MNPAWRQKAEPQPKKWTTDARGKNPDLGPPAGWVLGVPIWGLDQDQLIELAARRLRRRQSLLVSTANAFGLVTAQHNEAYLAHLQAADLVIPDGILAVWAARALGLQVRQRVAGPDFATAMLEVAADEGWSVCLMGSTEETLARIRRNFARLYPRLAIAGLISPPFGEFDAATNQRLVAGINRTGADLLFVGMTAPKQELWLSQNRPQLEVPFMMGIGYAFETMAGNRARIPQALGQLGLESFFRVVQDPRRLWRRALVNTAVVPLLVADEWRRRRSAARGPSVDRSPAAK